MKKKNLIPVCIFLLCSMEINAVDIWISPQGSDHNPGTREQPMSTLMIAQRKIRELRRLKDASVKDGANIILMEGTYQLEEPLIFRPEDAGNETNPTCIIASPGSSPVISGGLKITNWKKTTEEIRGLPKEAQGNTWVADIPKQGGQYMLFRQLWVNDRKAVRASSLNDGNLPRILSVNKKEESFMIPSPAFNTHISGQLEFIIHQWWAIAILRVKEIIPLGDSSKITFYQPESRIEFEHPWPAPFIDEGKKLNGNSAFYFTNAIQLLNQPGEWFADYSAGKIYYWPLGHEDMTKASVIVPSLENIIIIEGTPDTPVSWIQFKGIRFQHTTWLRPSNKGHVPLQAGWSITDAYKLKVPGTADKAGLENQAWIERQPAGVSLSNIHHIIFQKCSFEHMAATGLDFISGTNHNLIEGCVIRDIGGTGIQMGFFGSPVFEAHVPYNPSDEREICHHEIITNNLITDCSNEDWGCVGISVGYASDIVIEHNEVSHLNYSGICVGWGWTKTITCMKNNLICANYIHHFAKNMYDVGGIYMLSAQPNAEISENRIESLEKAPYAHIPEHYQYIYFDEGSSYIRAINNWTEKDKFFSNSPGPGNKWENNGPQVNITVKEKAGLEKKYKDLLK